MDKIKVLYVVGGIEAHIMNYLRNFDKSKIQVDFVVHGYGEGVYDKEIEQYGGVIYNVPIKTDSYFKNIKELKKIRTFKNIDKVETSALCVNRALQNYNKENKYLEYLMIYKKLNE